MKYIHKLDKILFKSNVIFVLLLYIYIIFSQLYIIFIINVI